MFVINFKLDYKKILITCVVIALFVATIIEFGSNKTSTVNSSASAYDFDLNEENYTALLKEVHDNIDGSIGKTIHMSGFVFRMPDFKENYFVCGRNTISNSEDKIAGFLCQYDDASKVLDNEWIEITGVIIKGDYNGSMPIIKIGSLNKITAPANTFVENINEKNSSQ